MSIHSHDGRDGTAVAATSSSRPPSSRAKSRTSRSPATLPPVHLPGRSARTCAVRSGASPITNLAHPPTPNLATHSHPVVILNEAKTLASSPHDCCAASTTSLWRAQQRKGWRLLRSSSCALPSVAQGTGPCGTTEVANRSGGCGRTRGPSTSSGRRKGSGTGDPPFRLVRFGA